MRRVTPGLVLLRATGVAALVLLLWNPVASRPLSDDVQPIVLLDASLSMTGDPWRAALDTTRSLGGALVWRFGTSVAGFDTTAPADGASRLAPALEAAAARGGEVIVVTDGAVDDAATIPPDLLRRARVVVVPRPPFFDAFVASVEGRRRVTRTDTVRLRVSYGTAGNREPGNEKRTATLTASLGGRRVASRVVELPDSGVLGTELTFPVSRFPSGWSVVDVRLDGVGDAEPRDDARRLVIEVSPQPAAVIFAAPPGWETRFLARILGDVARVPVKAFVETERGRWRDAATLLPASAADLSRAAQGARLVVLAGDPERARRYAGSAALLVWPEGGGRGGGGRGVAGDWYVERPPASPLAAALAGIAWDSLPPALAVADAPRDSGAVTALTARLARRGAPRPIVTLDERSGRRRATVTGAGLWRWGFRGGVAAEAYRGLIAALVDWLLGQPGGAGRERALPLTLETPNGMPLVWRWTGADEARPLPIDLSGTGGARRDTLRFDAASRAELLLPPGIYVYALPGGAERGVVAVEEYSDEWRPRSAAAIPAQPGTPEGRVAQVGMRDRWWLFVLAIAAFSAEWAWRRRQGLP